jgi:hypothetical protein
VGSGQWAGNTNPFAVGPLFYLLPTAYRAPLTTCTCVYTTGPILRKARARKQLARFRILKIFFEAGIAEVPTEKCSNSGLEFGAHTRGGIFDPANSWRDSDCCRPLGFLAVRYASARGSRPSWGLKCSRVISSLEGAVRSKFASSSRNAREAITIGIVAKPSVASPFLSLGTLRSLLPWPCFFG